MTGCCVQRHTSRAVGKENRATSVGVPPPPHPQPVQLRSILGRSCGPLIISGHLLVFKDCGESTPACYKFRVVLFLFGAAAAAVWAASPSLCSSELTFYRHLHIQHCLFFKREPLKGRNHCADVDGEKKLGGVFASLYLVIINICACT